MVPNLAEHPLPRTRDPHPRDFHLARARDHALGGHRRETGADKLRDVRGREAVRVQDRFRAAFGAAAVQQFKRPDAVGLDGASAMARRRHRGGRITGCTRDTVGLAIARENQAQLARRDTIGTPATLSIDIIALFPL